MESQLITIGDLVVVVSIVVPIVLAIIGATWKISRALSSFENRIVELESDKYPLSTAFEQSLRMALSNPGIVVHDPRDPSEIIKPPQGGQI